ncbi:HupE/UreJ family protein [Hymenobacter properus]|uniref:HupE/UreJ family protein n=1 Tax=Hymenobacter properus TaxID=2791026 RepID=A0A931BI87_9BACT|nr:HupE/UreJ family protein [Hymenobacter properus]MBF9141832.1 HupE/UreJ family protein [Hymenobacter properus]MBR7720640.1 HupE/UreJ family protein [Microvirga sp. SRT04]
MPNSVVLLDLHPGGVAAEVQLPLGQLEIAFGQNLTQQPETLVQRLGPELRAYIQQHVRPETPDGQPWAVAVRELRIQNAEQTATGPYQELTAQLWLTPPAGATARAFTFKYDVIVHQLVTHVALVSVRRDWEVGRVGTERPIDVGVVRLDVVNNVVPPLFISQAGDGWWAGFRGMVGLGVRHIAEGTDHLLFLLVLLLPAPLLLGKGERWGRFGGTRYSVRRLLLVVSAFTLGHSVTLLAGALGWLRLPGQLVEVLIAVSILVSAVHAVRPLFPGREGWVAAGFGLVHGLAFASTLAELNLPAGPMAVSILGFNLGIELMQLFVIALTVPWLLLLSQTPSYPAVRMAGAVAAGVAALAWIAERISAHANPLTALVARLAQHAPWLLAMLAVAAVVSFQRQRRTAAQPLF